MIPTFTHVVYVVEYVIFFFLFITSLSKYHAKQSTTHVDTYTPAGRKLMRLDQAAPVPASGLVTFLLASTMDLTKTAGGRKEFLSYGLRRYGPRRGSHCNNSKDDWLHCVYRQKLER